ncbi:MAG: hypothetical protein CFH03_01924, partial [Alphaproteobacteria bacterium MarineAlpha3_Bin2]
SAFGGKADIIQGLAKSPLIAKSGHFSNTAPLKPIPGMHMFCIRSVLFDTVNMNKDKPGL